MYIYVFYIILISFNSLIKNILLEVSHVTPIEEPYNLESGHQCLHMLGENKWAKYLFVGSQDSFFQFLSKNDDFMNKTWLLPIKYYCSMSFSLHILVILQFHTISIYLKLFAAKEQYSFLIFIKILWKNDILNP